MGARLTKVFGGLRVSTSDGVETTGTLFEGEDFANFDQDEQANIMLIHEQRLTNMETFYDTPVWRQVVGKLKSMEDIDNCSSASPFFGNLLQKEKREREVLLPTVFGILATRYYKYTQKDESYVERNFESIPWKMRWENVAHPMTGIFKCRLVCKKWNAAIEECHRNENAGHYQIEKDLNLAENGELGEEWGTEEFRSESEVVQFLDHFQTTHYRKKCPFLGRAVMVEYHINMFHVENKEAYFSKLLELFEKFGEQVWYLKFRWVESNSLDELVGIYQLLKKMVGLMPNLKVLRISCDYRPPKKVEQGLEGKILRNPFPVSTNLKMIYLDFETPVVFANHLVRQNHHICRLQVMKITFSGNCLLFGNKLPYLSHLSLVDVNSLEIFESFESYPAILNLTKLTFQFDPNFPFVTCSRIFNAINSKLNSDICTELVLRLPISGSRTEAMSVLQDTQECRLKLRKIHRVHLVSSDHISLDFLLSSKNSLREMEMMIFRGDPKKWRKEQVTQIVKILDIQDITMKNSNIAKELPALRKLIIEFSTREKNLKNLLRHYSIRPSGVIKVTREELSEQKRCEVTGRFVMETKINTF